jgi:hypothetical protein
MTDFLNKTPLAYADGDYLVVHRRPADFDANDPTKQGTAELIDPTTLPGGGIGGSDEIDGGDPSSTTGTEIDGGTP